MTGSARAGERKEVKTEEAAQKIKSDCEAIEGMEICFDTDGPEIYWENLRVACDPKDLPKALKAIRTLKDLGAYFG